MTITVTYKSASTGAVLVRVKATIKKSGDLSDAVHAAAKRVRLLFPNVSLFDTLLSIR
jgi:hypothetical protein